MERMVFVGLGRKKKRRKKVEWKRVEVAKKLEAKWEEEKLQKVWIEIVESWSAFLISYKLLKKSLNAPLKRPWKAPLKRPLNETSHPLTNPRYFPSCHVLFCLFFITLLDGILAGVRELLRVLIWLSKINTSPIFY